MLQPLVGILGQQGEDLGVGGIGRLAFARHLEGRPEVDEQFDALAARRAEVDGAPEERGGRTGVASLQRRLSGRADACECPVGEEPGIGRIIPQLDAIPIRLLEVIADDEVAFAGIGSRAALEPIGEAFVEGRPLRLRERLVGGITDEAVAEPEGVPSRSARSARAGSAPCGRGRAASARPPVAEPRR